MTKEDFERVAGRDVFISPRIKDLPAPEVWQWGLDVLKWSEKVPALTLLDLNVCKNDLLNLLFLQTTANGRNLFLFLECKIEDGVLKEKALLKERGENSRVVIKDWRAEVQKWFDA